MEKPNRRSAGGIGGLLSRSHAYQSGSGSFTNHNYYHADGNGNVTYMVDTNQSMVATYRYDPFGNTISSSGTLAAANVYRFSSKERHANSGMYYYGYRWYDPNLQRWLNRDPLQEKGFKKMTRAKGGGTWEEFNLYVFAHNKPISKIDPFGLRIPVIGAGGKLCVSPKCNSGLLANFSYVGEDDDTGPLRALPDPGNCVEADAVYYPGGADKISDLDQMTIECNECGDFTRFSGSPSRGHWQAWDPGTPPTLPPRKWPRVDIPPYDTEPPHGRRPPTPQTPMPTPIQPLPSGPQGW